MGGRQGVIGTCVLQKSANKTALYLGFWSEFFLTPSGASVIIYMTPYEKLKSLPDAAACLKPGTTFAKLDAVAFAMSDNEAAQALDEARTRLFRSIHPAA